MDGFPEELRMLGAHQILRSAKSLAPIVWGLGTQKSGPLLKNLPSVSSNEDFLTCFSYDFSQALVFPCCRPAYFQKVPFVMSADLSSAPVAPDLPYR